MVETSWVRTSRPSPAAHARTSGSSAPPRPTSTARAMSSRGSRRRNARTTRPSKFSSARNLIRSPPGGDPSGQPLADLLDALAGFDPRTDVRGGGPTAGEVVVEFGPVAEVVGEHRVDVGQGQ